MNRNRTKSNRPPRLLGVFAHPDDEVFCAGGTLAHWADGGAETMIVSATRGEAGQIQDAHAASRATLGAVREQELRAACARLGVRRAVCLDYPDGALAAVDSATLSADVAAYIREFQPDIVVTFGPDGGSGHPDHIAISLATAQACALVAREDGWAPELYYSVFPRQGGSLCQSLAHWLASHGDTFCGSEEFVRALALVADEAALMGYVDDTAQAQWYSAGFAIVEQGERGDCLRLIIAGHVQERAEAADGACTALRTLGPGQFFGAEALAREGRHEASYVALDTVTCLSLSIQAPTAFDARGAGALVSASDMRPQEERSGLIRRDITAYLERKAAALAAHRTQFAVGPELLALAPVWRLMSCEYFERVVVDSKASHPLHMDDAFECGVRLLLPLTA